MDDWFGIFSQYQVRSNFLAMATLDLVSMHTSSTRFAVVLIQVKVENLLLKFSVFIDHGPIR